MIVVKVGGSLFDLPDLGHRLVEFLSLIEEEIMLVAGGGPEVDRLRMEGDDEEACHWRAIEIMSGNAEKIGRLLFEESVRSRVRLLDATEFVRRDECQSEKLPHTWEVTSDSIAARVAEFHRADELILLKSIHVDGAKGWREAASRGAVDQYFPTIAERFRGRIRVVNLREVANV